MIVRFLKTVDDKKIFVEPDAWRLFKFVALSEVFGWTALIYGIVAERFLLPGSSFALPIGGSVHGMLFLAYLGILLATYSSLGWSRGKALAGLLISALPYGTLFFEIWAEKVRRRMHHGSSRRIVVRAVIADKGALLAFQPSNTSAWRLPGGAVGADETTQAAMVRLLKELLGIDPLVGGLLHVQQMREHGEDTMELYFRVLNVADFKKTDLTAAVKSQSLIDEMQFIDPQRTAELEPEFLRSLAPPEAMATVNVA